MRGRKPIPSNIRLLSTDRIHRKPAPDATQPDPGAPLCPDVVRTLPAARLKWRKTLALLSKAGRLTALDADALAAYCIEWAHFGECELFVRENGSTAILRNDKGEVKSVLIVPQENMRMKHLEKILKYQIELGLTPVSRQRLPAAKAKKETQPNRWEALL